MVETLSHSGWLPRILVGLLGTVPGFIAMMTPVRAENRVTRSRNALVIVADDLGVDMLACYGEGKNLPPTPNLDRLRSAGVLFRNAWSNPVCSSTRATIQTGRYGFRTGVGFITQPGASHENTLPLGEVTLAEALHHFPERGYSTAAIGKWHLSNDTNSPSGAGLGPNDAGYQHFSGALYNLSNYFRWSRTVNGDTDLCENGDGICENGAYATSVNVDDAIAWIRTQHRPWFLWLAFNAPHAPFQAPPRRLHGYDLPVSPRFRCPIDSSRLCYLAMIEAMDREIGRLLNGIPNAVLKETTIVFVGDNGTPPGVTIPPFVPDHAKATIYEGGVNVPLIIAGRAVRRPGAECKALVNTTDLFRTILELLLGDELTSSAQERRRLDSFSLVPFLADDPTARERRFVFAEQFRFPLFDADGKTIRNRRYKLLIFERSQTEEFYDLLKDPFESDNLLRSTLTPAQERNLHQLRKTMDDLLTS